MELSLLLLSKLEERVLKGCFAIANVEIGFLLHGSTQVKEELVIKEFRDRVNKVLQIEHVVDEGKREGLFCKVLVDEGLVHACDR